ncbi:flagellar basal-body MS-ring/collar protein FliF [Parachitinimonas caeni]|uniref:Flagellar M-ring protein n=1 Tax=Parachitinimonas caeni TaxID=3031301 RepID=A0ABT7E1B9_9NEIS|nr:flagellar basal-body MS-ring/collar protein FliF [Parachitinimonas caeni]MDK2125123.1 flagellar basal-body MS-ring/collar protein FliF [Parachitinimonas caeni]
MSIFSQMWGRFDLRAKIGFVLGLVGILIVTIALAFWALRPDYRTLFSGLAAQDSAAMVAELDKMKVPYQISDDGESILVAADAVHKTRMKILAKDIPLHGTVGFELFNNSDFGMTEFAQKVNYQRAMQGELTRTILAIDDVSAARVHLAIGENGLLKRQAAQSKASVTLTLKPGRVLSGEQVRGIQRLVSASVPEVKYEDVTVLDQHGVALTRQGAIDPELDRATTRFDMKRNAEEYLTKKVLEVVERTYGKEQAVATVSVDINHDKVEVTTEDVLPSGSKNGASGVLVKERRTSRETSVPSADKPAEGGVNTVSSESEYQVGRRVEQVVSAPGAISRLTVAVVVKAPLDENQLAKLKDLVTGAVGIDGERGDTLSVLTLAQLQSPSSVNNGVGSAAHDGGARDGAANGKKVEEVAISVPVPTTTAKETSRIGGSAAIFLWLGGALLVICMVLLLTRSRSPADFSGSAQSLDDTQRSVVLRQVQDWLEAKPTPDADAVGGRQ